MDPIEYLIKNKNKYSGDNFYVKPFSKRKEIVIENVAGKSNSIEIIKIILDNIAQGNKIIIKKNLLVNVNDLFLTLMDIYEKWYIKNKNKQEAGIKEAKLKGVYMGRKPIEIDKLLFLEQIEMLENHKIPLRKVL